jgi:hypothetical protein
MLGDAARFCSAVLNTTELYHRVPLPAPVAAMPASSDPERSLRRLRALCTASEAP